MMQAFRKVLYSETVEKSQKAFDATLNVGSMYPKWQTYINYNCTSLGAKRACLVWRDHTTRSHHTK